jgi:ADP-sugar diphosphatase
LSFIYSLIDLTSHLWKDHKWPGIFPSPGGCDEFIKLYVYRTKVTAEKIESLRGKTTGNLEDGEVITLKVIPLDQLWNETPDCKSLTALALYRSLNPIQKK